MAEQEVETIPPWLAVVVFACLIGLVILFMVSQGILSFLVFPPNIG
jgi:hypothetical protein